MNRIRILRLDKKLKQEELSKIINVSQATVSGYENGKYEPDNKTLLNLAAYFGVTTDYLLCNDHIPESFTKLAKKTPILRYIRDGLSTEVANELVNYDEISEDTPKQGEYYAVTMQGDSMEPRIQDGDIVIVHKQTVESGDVAAISISGNDATIKKIVKYKGGITLIPYNPKHNPTSYSKEEINSLPIIVIGKAIELRGKC